MQSIHESVFIAHGAQIYGRVTIAEGASLWPHATIRAEACGVRIGRMTNLQDFTMVHVGYDAPTTIGAFCSITHHATVHGCTVGDHCLIGIGATIMDGAVIGEGSIVGGGCLVPEGKVFEPGAILVGIPAKQVGTRDASRENRLNAWNYWRNAQAYKRGEHRAWDGDEYRAWLERTRALIEADRDLTEIPR